MIFEGEDRKLTIENFKGIYSRGSVDEVPLDHAIDCQNVNFTDQGHAKTRSGLIRAIALTQGGGLRRFFGMTSIPASYGQPAAGDPTATDGQSLLWLDNAHNLYIGNDPTPLYTLGGMADFAAINIANRTFVSPFTGQGGLLKGKLQVLDPQTGVIRDAAGFAPEQASGSSLNASNSATAGNVAAGVHQFAIVYETDTGFWTQPGPKIIKTCTPVAAANPTVFTCTGHKMVTGESHRLAQTGTWGNPFTFSDTWHITRIDDDHFSIPVDSRTFGAITGSFQIAAGFLAASVTADGTHAIDVGAIPVGASFVKRRIVIATRADEKEFFFVPNVPGSLSELNDNTTTSTTVNFDDTDLIASADYLFDILEAIPGGSSLCKYRNRLVIAGPYLPGIQERVLVSNINDPETFNWVSGYIQVQTERDNNDVFNCCVLRDTLYLSKFVGTFATEDNGGNPSTWPISVVDAVVGCYAYGASSFTTTQSTPDTGDIILFASKSGLYLFDGVMRRPELSWKIQSIWQRIPANYFFRVTVGHDPWNHLIYIACPLDGATEPNTLLVGDYSDGRDFQNIRWSIHKFHKNPTCIGMLYFGSLSYPGKYSFKMGTIDAGSTYLYAMDDSATDDDGTKITSYYNPGLFSYGGVGCFKNIRLRARGIGSLNIKLQDVDGAGTVNPTAITLTVAPRREFDRQINFVNEKLDLTLTSGTTIGDYMILDRIDMWGLPLFPIRPSV